MFFETIAMASEGAAPAAQGAVQPGPAEFIASFLPIIVLFVFMYFIMIRPRRKEEKALRDMISKMKVGDKVTSIGGIAGKVNKIKDDFIILETGNLGTIDQKSYIKLERSAIKKVETKIEA